MILDSEMDVQIAHKVLKKITDHIESEIGILEEDIFKIDPENLKAEYLRRQAEHKALVNMRVMISQLIFNTSKEE